MLTIPAGDNNFTCMNSYPCVCPRLQEMITVFAELPFELRRQSQLMFHCNAPRFFDVQMCFFSINFELFFRKRK